ncbi:HNH endonuclease [Burkholderia sp. Bp9143]|nr:HNH endonuclease [Burkholderia sp. Bp9143]
MLSVEHRCRVTGITDKTHLIASHIKPWRLCERDEHWDGNNGLLLAPHVDHLFDKGRISFADDGTMLISRFQDRSIMRAWGLPEVVNVGGFNAGQRRYLEIHREVIFERTRSWRAIRDAMVEVTV